MILCTYFNSSHTKKCARKKHISKIFFLTTFIFYVPLLSSDHAKLDYFNYVIQSDTADSLYQLNAKLALAYEYSYGSSLSNPAKAVTIFRSVINDRQMPSHRKPLIKLACALVLSTPCEAIPMRTFKTNCKYAIRLYEENISDRSTDFDTKKFSMFAVARLLESSFGNTKKRNEKKIIQLYEALIELGTSQKKDNNNYTQENFKLAHFFLAELLMDNSTDEVLMDSSKIKKKATQRIIDLYKIGSSICTSDARNLSKLRLIQLYFDGTTCLYEQGMTLCNEIIEDNESSKEEKVYAKFFMSCALVMEKYINPVNKKRSEDIWIEIKNDYCYSMRWGKKQPEIFQNNRSNVV